MGNICNVEGCHKPSMNKIKPGPCHMHKSRQRGQGKLCKVETCQSKPYGKGYCAKHYERFRTHGDPLYEWVIPRGLGIINGGKVIMPMVRRTIGYARLVARLSNISVVLRAVINQLGNGRMTIVTLMPRWG